MVQWVACCQRSSPSGANIPDGPCAITAPARYPRHCGSGKGSWVYDTIAADWRACWPRGNRTCRSNVDASSFGNRGRRTCGNSSTYVASALGSSGAETNTTVGGVKSKTMRPKKSQKEEARRAVRKTAGLIFPSSSLVFLLLPSHQPMKTHRVIPEEPKLQRERLHWLTLQQ